MHMREKQSTNQKAGLGGCVFPLILPLKCLIGRTVGRIVAKVAEG